MHIRTALLTAQVQTDAMARDEDPYGRDPRLVRLWGWAAVATSVVILVVVLLISHPWAAAPPAS